MFIVFEGIDGSGKDSAADFLREALAKQTLIGAPLPVRINEPDSTSPTGQLLRQCLKSGAYPEAHAAMFLADRMALHFGKILPALAAGQDVVCCRSFVSTICYQQEQWPGPEGLQWLFNIHRMLPTKIDYLVILDVDPAEGLKRVANRGGKAEYYEALDFQTRNRQRYLDLVADGRLYDFIAPGGKVIVQGTMGLDIAAVHAKILESIGGGVH